MAVDDIMGDPEPDDVTTARGTSRTRKVFKWLRVYLVPALGVICTAAGLGIGCFVRLSFHDVLTSDTVLLTFSIPGEVLMRMLKVIILPLVVSSTFSASSRLPTTLLGKMSIRILLFYLTTSLLSAVVGVLCVFVFQPKTWDFLHTQTSDYVDNDNYWLSILLDFIRNMLPENLIRAFYQHTQTAVVSSELFSYHYEDMTTELAASETTTITTLIDNFTETYDLLNVTDFDLVNVTNLTTEENALGELIADDSATETVFDAFADYLLSNLNWTDLESNQTVGNVTTGSDVLLDAVNSTETTFATTITESPPSRKLVKQIREKSEWIEVYKAGPSLMGLIVMHAAFGIASRHVKNKLVVLIDGFCTALHLVMIKMSRAIMWYFPIGVFFLTLTDVMATVEVYPFSQEMALFAAAMASAMVLHGVVTLSLLYWFLVRRNPFLFWKHNWTPFLVAFGTKSRVISLPFSMKSMEDKEGIDNRVTRLFLPLGSALNSDGDAIYGTVATLFLVQMSGVELSLEHYFYVCMLSFVLSFTSTTLHTKGIVYMHQLLIVQMSTQQLAVVASVDFIGGRLREMVNVISDAVAVSVMQHYGTEELKISDRGKNNLDKLNNRFIPKTYSYDSTDSMEDSDTNAYCERYTDV